LLLHMIKELHLFAAGEPFFTSVVWEKT